MTPEELSKLPRYDYYTNVKASRPDASDELCRAFADAMQGKLYGQQETLDAFGWFWTGWACSSGARTLRPEALEPLSEDDRYWLEKLIHDVTDPNERAYIVGFSPMRLDFMARMLRRALLSPQKEST